MARLKNGCYASIVLLLLLITTFTYSCKGITSRTELRIEMANYPAMLKVEREDNTLDILNRKHFFEGWTVAGQHGVWAIKKRAVISYNVLFDRDITIFLEGFSLRCAENSNNEIALFNNDHYIKSIVFSSKDARTYLVQIKKQFVHRGKNMLTLKAQHGCSLESVGKGNDRRIFYFKLNKVGIDSTPKEKDSLKNSRFSFYLPYGSDHKFIIEYGIECTSPCEENEKIHYRFELLKNERFAIVKENSFRCTVQGRNIVHHQVLLPVPEKLIPLARISIISPHYSSCRPLIKRLSVKYKKAAGSKKPNIILWMFDALRYDHVHHAGYYRKTTPALDSFAERGIVFKRAYAQAPYTVASIGSLLTSRYPFWKSSALLDDNLNTLPELLNQAGYYTVLISQNQWVSRSFNLHKDFTEDKLIHDDALFIEGALKSVVNAVNSKKKFFLYAHIIQPHIPYSPPLPFYKKFSKEIDFVGSAHNIKLLEREIGDITYPQLKDLVNQYDANIYYGDYRLSLFIKILKVLNLFNNELVLIFSSDHGEEFWDHGGLEHSATLYEEVIHVPLIIYNKKLFEKKRTIECPVELIDITPTILELAGMKPPEIVESGFEGKSLLPLINGKRRCEHEPVFSIIHDQLAYTMISSKYKLILCRQGFLGLQKFVHKCGKCFINLNKKGENCIEQLSKSERELYKNMLSSLRRWIDDEQKKYHDINIKARTPTISEEERENLEALGYLK